MSLFVLQKRGGKLVGARGVAFALDAFKNGDNFVDILIVDEFRNALKVSAATADEFNVTNFAVYHVEKNLTGASSFCAVGVHFFSPLFHEILVKQIEYEHAFFFPALVNVFGGNSARNVHFQFEYGMRWLDYFKIDGVRTVFIHIIIC